MLSKHKSIQRDQIEMIALDELVPANHLVRKLEVAIDFSFIYPLVKDLKRFPWNLFLLFPNYSR
jgi:hypothetical protein